MTINTPHLGKQTDLYNNSQAHMLTLCVSTVHVHGIIPKQFYNSVSVVYYFIFVHFTHTYTSALMEYILKLILSTHMHAHTHTHTHTHTH